MHLEPLDRELLTVFFKLASADCSATTRSLCAASGLSRPALYRRLARLDRSGLVDCRRLRLTLPGLAIACAAAAALEGEGAQRSAA